MHPALNIGTRDGLYQYDGDTTTSLLEEGPVQVCSGPTETVAWTHSTVYKATDNQWEPIEVPADTITSVTVTGESIHVGAADPLSVLTFTDSVQSWEQRRLPDLPAATRWLSGEGPRIVDESGGRVSDIIVTTEGLVVGVERAGVFVHRDGSWTDRSLGLHEDIHELLAVEDSTWYATTGGGFYRTDCRGKRWRHIDTGQRFQQYTYYHALADYDGTVHVAGGAHMPGSWGPHGADCLLFRLRNDTLVEDGTPDTTEYVWCLAVVEGTLYAGTVTQDLDQQGTAPGRVLRRADGDWEPIADLPAGITSIVAAG